MQTTTLFTSKDYTPWREAELEGKLLIIDICKYKEQYRDAKYQLVIATGGFGCNPSSLGNAIFVMECHNDNPESYRVERYNDNILGIATKEAIAEWKKLYGEFNASVMECLNEKGQN